ncbi:alpha/beta fold hydrolase [Streptomyces sodiiphilus]|uniref:Alpha/beta fold hydrolase n=1 Tax=Streptomyces sodiiphilus TaxID=226217 RepID=A0ABN2NX44_9ACTN
MPRPAPRTTALAITAVLALASCSGTDRAASPGTAADLISVATDTDGLPESLTGQQPDWETCEISGAREGDVVPQQLPDGTDWECATIDVPRDYAEPEGPAIPIAVIRARTPAPAEERLGSLLFNFGGPGGSGVTTLPAFGDDYAALHERYDLVSFDPRGVGDSEGLVCLDDEELDDWFAADRAPRTPREEAEYLQRVQDFAAACQERAGELLPHLTTTDTARDLDLIRHVLGDELLHYFGISYGTQLGGVYAHLFPERVGRTVFDAVVDPTLTDEQGALGQATGFQRALGNFLESCTAETDCPLGSSPQEAERVLGDFLERLREDPVPTRDPDGRPLSRSLAWTGIAQALYSQDFWTFLTQGLDDALDAEGPDGTVLLVLADALNGRTGDGSYSTLHASLRAVRCADSDRRYDIEDVRGLLPRFEEASPVFGETMAWSLLSCTGWPVDGESAHPEVGAGGAATDILLIGTTGDPATPYEGVRRMRQALGEGVSVELTYDGEGHGAYHSGNSCVRQRTDAYLLEGEIPADGTTCT